MDNRIFPLRRACHSGVDLLQIYWPGNLYVSTNKLRTLIKTMMFWDGLMCMSDLPCFYSVENLVPHDLTAGINHYAMTQRIINKCRGFIAMSDSAGKIFRNHYKLPNNTQVHIVPHRNYLDVYPNQITRQEARAILNIPSDSKVILSLGRIEPYKGLDRLIPAFLKTSNTNDILLIAGSAKSPEVINQLNILSTKHTRPQSGSVRVVGRFIKDEELQIFHRAADAVALTYSDMPMNPGSLIMAMGFGLPVIAPIKGAILETAGPDALFGYDENIESALTGAISNVLNSNILELTRKGKQAYELVASRNSRQAASAAFDSIYKSIFP
jgi:beta-1,4-mannosyltransferase